MAGNTRGKLKEQFEGIHRNFMWVQDHCLKSLALIEDKNPELSKSITALDKGVKTLDELAMNIYSKL